MSTADAFNFLSSLPPVKNRKDESLSCLHLESIQDGDRTICVSCGTFIESNLDLGKEWRSYSSSSGKFSKDPCRVSARKSSSYRGIHKDVALMNFSDEVVAIADSIFKEVTQEGIKRANSRKSIVFACIFHAYKIMGEPQPRDKLLSIFNIQKTVGNNGLKFVNLHASRFSPIRTSYITTTDFIQNIMENLSATQDHINSVMELYEQLPNTFHSSRPQTVAAGVIFFWMKREGIRVTIEEFSKLTCLSALTIEKLVKQIKKLELS